MHPSTEALLGQFVHEHLPDDLQRVARPFSELAYALACGDNDPRAGTMTTGHGPLSGPEATVALRSLREAKDATIRARLPSPGLTEGISTWATLMVDHYLSRFTYGHLPLSLQCVSAPLCALAHTVAQGPRNPDTVDALRDLLKAKDAAVRAAVASA